MAWLLSCAAMHHWPLPPLYSALASCSLVHDSSHLHMEQVQVQVQYHVVS